MKLAAATAPKIAVSGQAASAGPGRLVTQAMFTPLGAHTMRGWKGFRPAAIACGHHARSHT